MIKKQGVTMNTSDNYTVRRVVAVILMIFTFIFLFWPAFVKLTGIQEISLSEFRQYVTKISDRIVDSEIKTISIITNIAFFGMIGLAAAAVIAMALNKTKSFTAFHFFLSFFYFFVCIIAVGKSNSDDSVFAYGLSCGPSMFLIPIFSLAACIIYQEDDGQRSTSPQDNPWIKGTYQKKDNTQRLSDTESQTNSNRSVWTCPRCGTRNNENEMKCVNCYTRKPVVEEQGWTCPKCHANNETRANFCLNCGEPKLLLSVDKWVCPNCQERNIAKARFCINCGREKPDPVVNVPEPVAESAAEPVTSVDPVETVENPVESVPVIPVIPVGTVTPEPEPEPVPETESEFENAPEPESVPVPESEPVFETPAFCSNCGTKQEPGSLFCPNCGSKLI